MEKYKYSSLTDEQNEKIAKCIELIKDEKSLIDARSLGNWIICFLEALEVMCFISKDEIEHYRGFVKVEMMRKGERYGNLS